MSQLGIGFADKGIVVLLQRAICIAPFGRFATFAMVEIQRHIAAGVAVKSTVVTFAAIYKKLMFVHDDAMAITVEVNEQLLCPVGHEFVPSQHSVVLYR